MGALAFDQQTPMQLNQQTEFRQPKPAFHGEENFKEWVEKKLGLPSVIWVPCKSGLRRFVAEEKLDRNE